MTALATPLVQQEPIDVVIRPAVDAERRWICGTWSRCFVAYNAQKRTGPRHRAEWALPRAVHIGAPANRIDIDASVLLRAHHRLVDSILADEATSVVVAHIPDMPTEPCGWVVFESPTIHFVYVSPVARRSTVGRQLVLHTGCSEASHMTPDGLRLRRYLGGT